MILERFEEGNLAEGTGGNALLLVVELDVLDCDCAVVLVDCLVDPTEGALPDLANLPIALNFFHLNIQTYRAGNK